MSTLRLALAGFVAGVLVTAGIALLLVALVTPPSPSVREETSPSAAPPTPSPAAPSGAIAPTSSTSAVATPGPFGVGALAPGLALPQLGAGTFDLASLRGHPVWVVFTATWCPSCLDDAAAMSSFAARYEPAGLVVVAVDVREDEGTVAAFAASADPVYPIALDAEGAAARRWGVLALPTHFFIDASGVVRAGATGTIGRDVLADSLRTILPGVDVIP